MPSDKTRILGPAENADPSRLLYSSSLHQGLPEVGLKLGSLCLVRKIGSGGMGAVYEAKHEILQRSFAVKFLESSLANNTELRERFQQETVALGKLDHPNIVQPIDAGEWNGRPYLVTELLRGHDLTSLVNTHGPMSIEDSVAFVAQAAKGLHFAHQNGFVHRDIKPSNLFLCDDGSLKLIDFGLVRCCDNDSELTRVGQFLGSVDFLSPEQASDPHNTDFRSDIYSLGCTWIYLLSGMVPFPDTHYPSVVAKLKGHMMDCPPWLQQAHPDVQPELLNTLRYMVAKQPADRQISLNAIFEKMPSAHGQEKLSVAVHSIDSPSIASTTSSPLRQRRTIVPIRIAATVIVMLCCLGWAVNRRKENLKLDSTRVVSPSSDRAKTTTSTGENEKKRESLHAGRVRNALGGTVPISKSTIDATIIKTSTNE